MCIGDVGYYSIFRENVVFEIYILERVMPTIARFYGILIKMYFKEHGVPHFHALYGEFNGVFNIESLEMIEGDLSQRAQELIREWGEMYRNELLDMWGKQQFKKIPGLE